MDVKEIQKVSEMVEVFKQLVLFVTDAKAFTKFSSDSDEIKKVLEIAKKAEFDNSEAAKKFALAKESEENAKFFKSEADLKSISLDAKEAKLLQDEVNLSKDKAEVAKLLSEATKENESAKKNNSIASADREKAEQTMKSVSEKEIELNSLISEYKEKLQKLSEV